MYYLTEACKAAIEARDHEWDTIVAQARVEDPLVGETFEERLASIMEFHRFLRNGGFENGSDCATTM